MSEELLFEAEPFAGYEAREDLEGAHRWANARGLDAYEFKDADETAGLSREFDFDQESPGYADESMRLTLIFEAEPFSGYMEFDEAESAGGWSYEFGDEVGGKAEYVRWVQRSLNKILALRLAEDGDLGTKTRSAVRSFQQRAGLQPDGIPGPRTTQALVAAGASPPPTGASGSAPTGTTPQGQTPSAPATTPGGVVSTPCPVHSPAPARDRCPTPGVLPCPAIPDLLCVTSVSSVPFEYVLERGGIVKDASGLFVVKKRKTVTQRFTPAVAAAVAQFIANMATVGMRVEAIFTGGSLYCRCITGKQVLSNHSFGDAIDVVGIRWSSPAGSRETIVHNYANAAERAVLRRINACLRLSFATVIDYHRSDHRDHFHCDTNRGHGRASKGGETVVFIKEALNTVLGLSIPETKTYDAATAKALGDFSGRSAAELSNPATFNGVLDALFSRVARG